jgi:hypothetical protein
MALSSMCPANTYGVAGTTEVQGMPRWDAHQARRHSVVVLRVLRRMAAPSSSSVGSRDKSRGGARSEVELVPDLVLAVLGLVRWRLAAKLGALALVAKCGRGTSVLGPQCKYIHLSWSRLYM